ncbi:MAG: hypothetical protein ABIP80_06515 [Ferruginibacter sp.]
MTSKELTQKILLRIVKYKIVILLSGILLAVGVFFYSRTIPDVYSSKATVFPLSGSNDNTATSALSSALGLSEGTGRSFSQDAAINIIELANSRSTREAVAMVRLEEIGNRTIAELVIANSNKNRGIMENEIATPVNPKDLAAIGGIILMNGFNAKINKNGILEISYSSTDQNLVSPISYVFIDKISAFYKDLKIRKATIDYNFTLRKIDSLQQVLNVYDRRAVRMNNTTLFTPLDKIQYTIPKENLAQDKQRVIAQRDASANNREEALWRLQKVTPIIATLDKPDPPFFVKKPSVMIYTLIGFVMGCILSTILLVAGNFYIYAKVQASSILYSGPTVDNATSTTI